MYACPCKHSLSLSLSLSLTHTHTHATCAKQPHSLISHLLSISQESWDGIIIQFKKQNKNKSSFETSSYGVLPLPNTKYQAQTKQENSADKDSNIEIWSVYKTRVTAQ